MFKAFNPVYDKNSEVLILGSFPSVKSRENGFYYANKRNRFWKVMGQIFDEEIDDDINSKTSFLLRHKIALYDVVVESDLKGSKDDTLLKSTIKISNIEPLLPPCTNVKYILCNGKTAYNLLVKHFKTNMPILCLPSTSPLNTRFNFEEWYNALSFLK